VDKARDILDRYIFKDEVGAELFRAALWLAQLDVLSRTLMDCSGVQRVEAWFNGSVAKFSPAQ
jgi:hypothetical protein